MLRNRSIVVELFHGQLKSKVTCRVCQRESVRFDAFNFLSLPLPLESYVHVEVVGNVFNSFDEILNCWKPKTLGTSFSIVIRLDGSVPVKYGLRSPMDASYQSLKERLSSLCHIPADNLLFAEVSGAMIKVTLLNFIIDLCCKDFNEFPLL